MQQWGCCFLNLQRSLSLCYLHQLFSSLALHAPMSEEETWCSALCIPQPSSNWIAVPVSVLQGGIIIIKRRWAYGKEKWRERISGHSQSAEEKITGTFRNRESFEAGKDCTEWEGWWAWVPQKQQQQGLHKKKNVQPSPPCIPTLLSACPLVVTPSFHIPPSLQLLWDYCSLKSPTSLSLYTVQIQHRRSLRKKICQSGMKALRRGKNKPVVGVVSRSAAMCVTCHLLGVPLRSSSPIGTDDDTPPFFSLLRNFAAWRTFLSRRTLVS